MWMLHCTFCCSVRTNEAWQEPGGSCRSTGHSGGLAATAWLSGGGTQLCHPCPSAAAGGLVPWGLPHPRVLGGKALRQRLWGTKGPLLRSCVDVLEWWQTPGKPRPAGAARTRAPSPQPGGARSSSGPRAAAHHQPVGLEGRLGGVSCWKPKCPGLENGGRERRRTPLPPSQPEPGGCRGRWGLRTVPVAPAGHRPAWAGLGWARGTAGPSADVGLGVALCPTSFPLPHGSVAACPCALHRALCSHQLAALLQPVLSRAQLGASFWARTPQG